MTPHDPAEPQTPAERASEIAQQRRVAFERLRERTDELELLISGISLLSLIALPGWLFDRWIQAELHYEGVRHVILTVSYQFAAGLSYAMSTAFLLHLAVRAYWVGLIGLKATFPGGIRWNHLRNSGPIARDYFRRTVVDLDTAIDAADRIASVIFALVSLVVLSVIWIALSIAVLFTLTMLLVEYFRLPEWVSTAVFHTYMGALIAIGVAIGVLDLLPERLRLVSADAPARWRTRIVEWLLRMFGLFSPQRLILPVQLSLQSNLSRRAFFLGFSTMVLITTAISIVPLTLARRFAPAGSYDYLPTEQVGLRSAYYENLRGEHDRLLRVPLIPSDMTAESQLRLFLPYLPRRDNPRLRSAGCAPAAQPHPGDPGCLTRLWQVSLDGRPVSIADFLAAERRDLGMRGLQGYLSLSGLAPGRHELLVTWNPERIGEQETEPNEHRIAFWFAPPYQLDLGETAAAASP